MHNLTPEQQTLASDLNTRICAYSSWYAVVASKQPRWYGHLLTDLMLAIDDEELVYLTARFEHTQQTGSVVLFTPRSRIVATVADVKHDEARIEVTVRSRKNLRSIRQHGAASVFNREAFVDWPGEIASALTYSDDSTITIPLEPASEGRSKEELLKLITSLRQDLA